MVDEKEQEKLNKAELYDIVEVLFTTGKLYGLISPFVVDDCPNMNNELKADFLQDLCLELLTFNPKQTKKIIDLYNKKNKELDYFLLRIIKNNLFSTTSPFFRKYIKYNKLKDNIESYYGTEGGENEDESFEN